MRVLLRVGLMLGWTLGLAFGLLTSDGSYSQTHNFIFPNAKKDPHPAPSPTPAPKPVPIIWPDPPSKETHDPNFVTAETEDQHSEKMRSNIRPQLVMGVSGGLIQTYETQVTTDTSSVFSFGTPEFKTETVSQTRGGAFIWGGLQIHPMVGAHVLVGSMVGLQIEITPVRFQLDNQSTVAIGGLAGITAQTNENITGRNYVVTAGAHASYQIGGRWWVRGAARLSPLTEDSEPGAMQSYTAGIAYYLD